jgi:AraC-like DNA-binding protein
MPPLRVVALVREAGDQARLRRALLGSGELMACGSPNDVMAALADRRAVAVVLPAHGPLVSDAIALTREVRKLHPTVPVLIYCDGRYANPRDLLSFFQAGAAEIVQGGRDDLRKVFATVLATSGHRASALQIMRKLDPMLPPQARQLLEYLIDKGDMPLSIEQAASAVGVARRTLEKRLVGLGYPPPETLIGWCRLLVAAHLLEDQQRTFDAVATQLGFPSGMALRSMLKRYTGVSGREAREGPGPVALVLRHLADHLRTPQARAEIRKNRAAEQALAASLTVRP